MDKKVTKLKLLDTFAGIGGFSYAAEKIVGGFETTQFIEINSFSQKILKKHWPHVPIHNDIKTFTAKPFSFDVITGGFPCQDISTAGLQKGITKETRSGLFYELIRVIRMVRPKFVILENVAAILNNGLDIVLGELSEAGYDAEWAVISASSLGACHQRSRWWLVAYPNSIGCGGRSSQRRSIQERQLFQSERQGGEMGSEAQRCSLNTSNSNSERLQGRIMEIGQELQTQNNIREKNTSSVTDTNSTRTQSNSSRKHKPIWTDAFLNSKERRTLDPNWQRYVSEPCLCRGDDGLRGRMDRLKALGNSIVPAVAAIPLQRVHDIYFNEKR